MSQVFHNIEKLILNYLKENKKATIADLMKTTGLQSDQVRRGIEWLRHKNLVKKIEDVDLWFSLGYNGLKAVKDGLPERKLVNHVSKAPKTFQELKTFFSENEFNAAISSARKNNWIEIKQNDDGNKIISAKQNVSTSDEEKLIQLLENGKITYDQLSQLKSAYENLKLRPQFIEESRISKTKFAITKEGQEVQIKDKSIGEIDVEADVPKTFVAKTHPLKDTINEIREIFVTLGFTEISGNLVQPSFWNFDALFTPQDHPAREMQDTFYLEGIISKKIATPNQIQQVSKSHKTGWRYLWNIEEARKMVLRTHTTCVTIKHLADHKPDEARIFSLGRVFRNEKVSYKHLVEFNQVEGVVVGKNTTLRDLMGIQREFYRRMGLNKVKFWPTFFPYTEPSLQSMVYNERLDKWVELFGMGIFRPEVTKPLGIKKPVLAWGGGIERIAMLKYGLDDVREFYNNNLKWLRGVSKCQ